MCFHVVAPIILTEMFLVNRYRLGGRNKSGFKYLNPTCLISSDWIISFREGVPSCLFFLWIIQRILSYRLTCLFAKIIYSKLKQFKFKQFKTKHLFKACSIFMMQILTSLRFYYMYRHYYEKNEVLVLYHRAFWSKLIRWGVT